VAKPVIMSVDDDPEVLGAIERDLRQHYRSDYRILKASSGPQALDAARQLKQRGTPVALFLVDERMPEMTGTELLREVRKLHPDSRKVLLTAYADTEAAIRGINDVGLDHYLLKPWHPPALRLYPILDDLLSDWSASTRPPYDGIRVAGALWSPQSYAAKEFLSRNGVPYQWVDVEKDESVAELVAGIAGDLTRLPVILFGDGTALVTPSNHELAHKIGMQTQASLPFYDLVIVGGGPAGLAAAVYGASEGLRTLMVEQDAPGGQAGTSSQIENYLGFPSGVSGADLARRATAQARRFGAELLSAQQVVAVRRDDPYRVVQLADQSKVSCYAVILAQGVAVRTLEVPGLRELIGIGVYYGAAMTEAATYRGQDVCVVGGANSAGQGALFFSRYARRVTMLVRAESLGDGLSRYLVDRIEATPNIAVHLGVEVTSVHGVRRWSGS
jgi:thioredoxin reductase (NADPH)